MKNKNLFLGFFVLMFSLVLITTASAAIDGAGTLNYLSKWTSGTLLGNSKIFDNGTNVGIGTTNPATLLHLDTTATPSGFSQNDIRISRGNWGLQLSGGLIQNVGPYGLISTVAAGVPTERIRINNIGNVGIGTTNPVTLLHLDTVAAAGSSQNDIRITRGTYGLQLSGGLTQNVGPYGIISTVAAGVPTERMRFGDTGDVNVPGRLCIRGDCRPAWPSCPATTQPAPAPVVVAAAQPAGIIYDTGTRVGVGIPNPTQKLEVDGALKLNTAAPRPACDEGTRGTFWFAKSDAGDSTAICARDGTGSYGWKELLSKPLDKAAPLGV